MPSRASSSVALVLKISYGLTLQICLIIALSFRCRPWRFGFVNGQVTLAWSIAIRTQELYTRSRVLKERWREERAGSSFLNFFKAFSTRVVVESSQPPAAKSMSPRLQKEAIAPPAWQVRLGLPSVVLRILSTISYLYLVRLDYTLRQIGIWQMYHRTKQKTLPICSIKVKKSSSGKPNPYCGCSKSVYKLPPWQYTITIIWQRVLSYKTTKTIITHISSYTDSN